MFNNYKLLIKHEVVEFHLRFTPFLMYANNKRVRNKYNKSTSRVIYEEITKVNYFELMYLVWLELLQRSANQSISMLKKSREMYFCMDAPSSSTLGNLWQLETGCCLLSVWICRCHSQEHLHNQQYRLRPLHERRPAGEIRLPCPLLVSPAESAFTTATNCLCVFILVDFTLCSWHDDKTKWSFSKLSFQCFIFFIN